MNLIDRAIVDYSRLYPIRDPKFLYLGRAEIAEIERNGLRPVTYRGLKVLAVDIDSHIGLS